MSIFDTIAILLVLCACFGFINARVLRLPRTIALMLMGLGLATLLLLVGEVAPAWAEHARVFVATKIDFNEALMGVLLSFLLFAGALHVNLDDLKAQRSIIFLLASIGVLVSTFLVGSVFYYLARLFGLEISYLYCLVFGALISPTDPIAVLGILKKVGAPKTLETKICGESLFNDGVGVVVFLTLLGLATGRLHADAGHIAVEFVKETGGGIVLGLLLGWICYWMLKKLDDYSVEILITLACVTGGYSLAGYLHLSGPLAMVVAGLLIGNHGRSFAMSETTREHVDTFWELVDEILNALLFVLLGLELLILVFEGRFLVLGLLAIPLVLFARFIAVGAPIVLMRRWRTFTTGAVRVLTWGGLRGGISIALALSLPGGEERDLILTVTYVVVVFSIAVQGLTVGPLMRKLGIVGRAESPAVSSQERGKPIL
jgi:CPA1 family monovalent cation:H+ antiporter